MKFASTCAPLSVLSAEDVLTKVSMEHNLNRFDSVGKHEAALDGSVLVFMVMSYHDVMPSLVSVKLSGFKIVSIVLLNIDLKNDSR